MKEKMIELVGPVLSQKEIAVSGEFVPPKMIKEYMESLGYECSELETNGWDYDWWLIFTKGENKFRAFGCGYNGDFEFYASEE